MSNNPSDKVYSNKLMIAWLHFLDKKIGKAETDLMLDKLHQDRLKLMDQAGFMGAEENDAFVLEAIRVTGEQDLGYLAGRDVPNSLGKVAGFIIGVTSPAFMMKTFGQIEEKMALKTINRTQKVARNKFKVEISFRDGFKEKQYVCRNRIGCYESMPLFFGLPLARVEHPECAFEGAGQCIYIVQFPENNFNVFNRLFQASIFVALVLAGFWVFHPASTWLALTSMVLASFGFLSFAYYRGVSAKKSLEWSLLANEGISKQNRILENTNRQIQSLQELTILLNNSVQVQDLCEKVVRMLVRDFHFGSSQIWLLDEKQEYLSCHSALGYSESLQAYISNTRFRMGEDWDNPYGLLIQTLVEKKTLLINDPEEIYGRLTARTSEFLKALKISSFIITPLIHEDKPLGILAAEYHNGEKLQNQDKLLFQSISNSVANALVKADLFEQMSRKIEERTRQLEATSKELMAAQEMAIQSEKLSSLGQMAAGVAHEINNPLNFLVNIIPDVRRDVEGLEKIRDLAVQAGLNPEILKRIKEVDDQYDLESHLSEKNFVFEKIQKALDKSTRIANSLKVFSRSSTKEAIVREKFSEMIGEVIELLPQKVRGDTQILIDIPGDLAWNVNKNEMEQAFLALINNAIDAMEQKGQLEIRGVANPEAIVLSFKDSGPGIPEESLKRIFDPFYTTKPPGKGTGLGLTIASEIVKKYGGAMTVKSVKGQGATFELRFKKVGGD